MEVSSQAGARNGRVVSVFIVILEFFKVAQDV